MAFNILIVDDSSSMRSIIKKTIQISGFNVGQYFEGGNGEQALEVLNDAWVDVILTDIHMPEMDGISFLKAVQENEMLKSIPVIMITTEGREHKVNEAMSMGAKAYIRKPFTPEQIKKTLTNVIGADYVAEDQGDVGGSDF